MVVARYTYGKGRFLFRRTLAVFAFIFGFFAPYFTTAPKLWSPGSSHQNLSGVLFAHNIAHAEVPVVGAYFSDGDEESGASDAGAGGAGDGSGADGW